MVELNAFFFLRFSQIFVEMPIQDAVCTAIIVTLSPQGLFVVAFSHALPSAVIVPKLDFFVVFFCCFNIEPTKKQPLHWHSVRVNVTSGSIFIWFIWRFGSSIYVPTIRSSNYLLFNSFILSFICNVINCHYKLNIFKIIIYHLYIMI